MTDRAKFEQMLECLINEDSAKAQELFHEIVVAKSREIYESILADEFMEEDDESENPFEKGDEETDDFVSDVEDPEFGGDSEQGDESEESELASDVKGIKDELHDLVAKFNELLGDEAKEPEHADLFPGADEEAGDNDDSEGEESEEDMFIREYIEKVGKNWDSGFMKGETGSNTKSTVASKNDMGGTVKNLNQSKDGATSGTTGGLVKPKPQTLDGGNVNVPGAKNADNLSKVGTDWDKAKSSAEEGSVNDTAIIGKRVR